MDAPEVNLCYLFGDRTYELASRTHVMGILNVTPDSFSDGGKYLSIDRAVERGLEMVEEGADFIDIGGESTRPKGTTYGEGAEPVSAEEELGRVIPVIEELVRQTDVPLSIDTYKPAVAKEALSAGVSLVNDISGFKSDPAMARVIAAAGASAVIMHMRGTPKTTQANLHYENLFGEIVSALEEGLRVGREAGIAQLIVDPGIGFGKQQHHNLALLAGLSRFRQLGVPVLVGPSRKSFIGNILGVPPAERLEGSLAAVVAAVLNGANIVRVHDVRASLRATKIADAIKEASSFEAVGPAVP